MSRPEYVYAAVIAASHELDRKLCRRRFATPEPLRRAGDRAESETEEAARDMRQ
jgi:hypothetical protein